MCTVDSRAAHWQPQTVQSLLTASAISVLDYWIAYHYRNPGLILNIRYRNRGIWFGPLVFPVL